jgi:hypothetical protein
MNRLDGLLRHRPATATRSISMRALPMFSHARRIIRSSPSLSCPTRLGILVGAKRGWSATAQQRATEAVDTADEAPEAPVIDSLPPLPKPSLNATWPVRASVLSKTIPMVSHICISITSRCLVPLQRQSPRPLHVAGLPQRTAAAGANNLSY